MLSRNDVYSWSRGTLLRLMVQWRMLMLMVQWHTPSYGAVAHTHGAVAHAHGAVAHAHAQGAVAHSHAHGIGIEIGVLDNGLMSNQAAYGVSRSH